MSIYLTTITDFLEYLFCLLYILVPLAPFFDSVHFTETQKSIQIHHAVAEILVLLLSPRESSYGSMANLSSFVINSNGGIT